MKRLLVVKLRVLSSRPSLSFLQCFSVRHIPEYTRDPARASRVFAAAVNAG
jgi:hypothetical protein